MKKAQKVVIAGGGTAGWIAAATLSSQLGSLIDITLIESADIGTVGVGEATIPTHKAFHRLIGVDEQKFLQKTQATFKLGIEFSNWGNIGDSYFHTFGQIGRSTWMGDFQHLWQHAKTLGWAGDLQDYCVELQAAKAGKFGIDNKTNINYAYHLDAGLYASFLCEFSQQRGVKRIEGTIEHVTMDSKNDHISHLVLSNGTSVAGDLFIDCTGFKGLLINGALGVGFEDWSHWLPMDSAWAVQTQGMQPIPPYTKSIAHDASWQWRIPLQNRVGNGLVFCSAYNSEQDALQLLTDNIEGNMITEPRLLKFKTGKRKKAWFKNCVAMGLASGFLEPLESTSIHLSQIAATRLVQMFPFNGMDESLQTHYNNSVDGEVNSIRDFIILHYNLNQRPEPFWQHVATMAIPDSLRHRMELYTKTSIAYQNDADLFRVDSWNQVMMGQGAKVEGYHQMGRLVANDNLRQAFNDLHKNIKILVEGMPMHDDFLNQYGVL
ncbi:tryptophan 7-halogenase [Aliiglaciecola sp. 2_MG-2023]|uniref:tryptophan halogenase family protein n=1 Tax=unclassified Aliiglaciecola TaxID=2593648 RepID=UPI0026E338E5|nr:MULTISPECIES: tryptophan halogenase family protein [unclassified Aliiglaciecola]MDO6712395.1 tryptophan 7-halogenase [Aliiglaciecola sp. 2_MG-2023]MDO6753389.1 tryptophan 7-halogenase [Aliiglaciecola sp. 1_MG-2023]